MIKVYFFFFLAASFVFTASAQVNQNQDQNLLNLNIFNSNSSPNADAKEQMPQSNLPNNAAGAASNSSSALSANKSLGAFSTGDAIVDGYILDSAARHNIDPLLIFAQMSQESSFRKTAVSHKGARGLMQLMPATAVRWGVKNIYNPQQNIEAGVRYMRWLLDRYNGDVKLALAAYNAGEGAVKKHGNKIPPYAETRNYVARIVAHYDRIRM
jgi:soluble lytic murein transglycosylase-like protein